MIVTGNAKRKESVLKIGIGARVERVRVKKTRADKNRKLGRKVPKIPIKKSNKASIKAVNEAAAKVTTPAVRTGALPRVPLQTRVLRRAVSVRMKMHDLVNLVVVKNVHLRSPVAHNRPQTLLKT